MVFSSFPFIWFFLPLALLAYYVAARRSIHAANVTLAVSGYVFYAWSSPKFLLLMWLTTALDWALGLIIVGDTWRFWRFRGKPVDALPEGAPRSRLQRRAIALSVVLNLSSLAFFKYAGFMHETVQGIAASIGLQSFADHATLHIVLPLGISFYTFQSLSYTIDVFRGHARPMTKFSDFACFVSMFPHLVAGPILRFSFLSEQIVHRSITTEKIARGVALFCMGMSKKVLLANPAAAMADACFGAHTIGTLDAWAGALAYTMQIYFDFSGYSDMAVGLGLMLGFLFARNFDAPYRAESLQDFWRRWHISLSSWLRDYLYVPLGGSRRGPVRTYINLFLTMVLGGLWHGAAWTYVIWGAIHGGGLAVERAGGGAWLARLPRVARIALVFFVVMIAWVFFRAQSLGSALDYLGAMFGAGTAHNSAPLVHALAYNRLTLICFVAALIVVWGGIDAWRFTQRLDMPRAALLFAMLLVSAALLSVQSYNPFIYFIF